MICILAVISEKQKKTAKNSKKCISARPAFELTMSDYHPSQIDLFGQQRAQNPAHIVVVGSGVCGATLAYLLARSGVKVTLIEGADRTDRPFDDVIVGANASAFFQRLRLLQDDKKTEVTPLEQCDFHHTPHIVRRMLARQKLSIMPRRVIVQELIDKASAFEGFIFMRRVTVGDMVVQKGRTVGVHIHLADKVDVLRADQVIVAEGLGASLRQAHFMAMGKAEQSHHLATPVCMYQKIVGPAPKSMQSGVIDLFTFPKGYGVVRCEGGRLCLMLVWFAPPKSHLPQPPQQDWFASLVVYFPDRLAQWLTMYGHTFVANEPFVYRLGAAPRWHSPGVLFLGDGVHASPPFTCFGLEAALFDAQGAAQHLGEYMIDVPNQAHIDIAVEDFCQLRLNQINSFMMWQKRFVRARLNDKPQKHRNVLLPPVWWARQHMLMLLKHTSGSRANALSQISLFGETL